MPFLGLHFEEKEYPIGIFLNQDLHFVKGLLPNILEHSRKFLQHILKSEKGYASGPNLGKTDPAFCKRSLFSKR